jgi:hypothetical protein
VKLSRDTWLGLGVLLALIFVTSLTALQQNDDNQAPYLSTSSAPDGTLALSLWLGELGYETADAFTLTFHPDSDINLIVITQPVYAISANEWKLLDQWIQNGGVLLLSGTNSATSEAMQHFDFNLSYLPRQADEVTAALPLLRSPLLQSRIEVKTNLGLATARADHTPLMTAEGKPVIVAFQQGDGTVILSSMPSLLTNRELKKESVALLVLNLLAYTDQPGTVLFDEWHRGFQTQGVVGISQWLQQTAGGHAVLFVVFTVFVAFLLQGRAFGRPVPLAHELKRRGPMEHVTAVANLSRKAGHRREVARQYHHRLKRHLGQRYRLDPTLPDEAYADALAILNPAIEKDELLALLKQLSRAEIGDAELVKLSVEAAQWMAR